MDFQRELLARLPLADAVLSLLAYALGESFLNRLYEEHRGRCYERELSFPQLLDLIRDALLIHQGSGRASFERAQEQQQLPIAVNSVYQKLGRVPLNLSMALLRETTDLIHPLLPPASPSPMPACLQSLRVVVLDGKVLKHVHRRLKPLQHLQGKLTGGRLLVALAMHPGLCLAMNATPDAERNDVPLVPGTVQQVRQKVLGPILWITDRQMCDLKLLALFAQGQDHFLIRMNRTLSFQPDPQRPAQRGKDSRGRSFVQEWGWAGAASQKNRRYVRRITLPHLDKNHQPDDVILLTDLLEETAYPAADLLEAYLRRWGIEQVFQKVTEVFGLERLIGTRPQAIIFQAAFCFVLYNLIQVVRSYVAKAGDQPVESVSTAKLFQDVQGQLGAWAFLGKVGVLLEHTRGLTADSLRQRLQQRLGGLWRPRWAKCPSRPRPPGQRRTVRARGGRTSVWRALEAHWQERELSKIKKHKPLKQLIKRR